MVRDDFSRCEQASSSSDEAYSRTCSSLFCVSRVCRVSPPSYGVEAAVKLRAIGAMFVYCNRSSERSLSFEVRQKPDHLAASLSITHIACSCDIYIYMCFYTCCFFLCFSAASLSLTLDDIVIWLSFPFSLFFFRRLPWIENRMKFCIPRVVGTK